jgi:heme/copper-type cytochrome/quinol oxidase subunit 3
MLQLIEYLEIEFRISDSVFGSAFFIATGFHGFHVLVGRIFLVIK